MTTRVRIDMDGTALMNGTRYQADSPWWHECLGKAIQVDTPYPEDDAETRVFTEVGQITLTRMRTEPRRDYPFPEPGREAWTHAVHQRLWDERERLVIPQWDESTFLLLVRLYRLAQESGEELCTGLLDVLTSYPGFVYHLIGTAVVEASYFEDLE